MIYENQPQGKGHAVRNGLDHVSGDVILIQDADLEYDVDDYDAVIEPSEIKALGVTATTIEDGFQDADAILILNNHRSHASLDLFDLLKRTSHPCLFLDGWRAFDPEDVKELGHVEYLGVGSS